jgi:hypothetical protein
MSHELVFDIYLVVYLHFLDFRDFLQFLTIEAPFWPLGESLGHPNFEDFVGPNPPAFQASHKGASLISLHSDGRLGVIGYEVAGQSHDSLVLPDFLIKPF